jgi:hypothetical protein
MPRTKGRAAWAAAAAIVFGTVVPISASTTALAASTCPTMDVVGVRGSGETANDYDGYGQTVADVVDHIKSTVPSVQSHEVDYPAIAVGYGGIKYPSKYKASISSGRTALNTYIASYLKSTCEKSTHLYLVGYSQGAQVVGDVFQSLDTKAKARVASVVMIGDPRFNGAQKGSFNVGTYSHNLNGVAPSFSVASKRVISGTPWIRSYCVAHDPICNWTAANGIACKLVSNKCVHLHYADLTLPSKLTYTVDAANYLIGRWRVVGPKAPAIGPRTKVLIYGNGDAVEDTSGTPNLVAALKATGFTVSTSATLPTNLSSYGQVWHYGLEVPTTQEQAALAAFARAGGSLFLTGEWNGCCSKPSVNDAVKGIFDQLVVTVGGLSFGPDSLDVLPVNPAAIGSAATTPKLLTTLKGVHAGSIDMSNLSPSSALFRDGASHATAALWDESSVVGGGRLAIVMDVNWAQTSYGDMRTMPQNAQNIAYFLSGSVANTQKVSNGVSALSRKFIPAPATARKAVGGAAQAH